MRSFRISPGASFSLGAMLLFLCIQCGGGGSSQSTVPVTPPVTPPVHAGSLSLIAGSSISTVPGETAAVAGSTSGAGIANGKGTSARFGFPAGVAADGSGNLYIVEYWINIIRKIDTNGNVTTLAGKPGSSTSGGTTISDATFSGIASIAADALGNLYVPDGGVIRKIATDGTVSNFAGKVDATYDERATHADGSSTTATFGFWCGIAVHPTNKTIYVLDGNLIRSITPDGATVSTFAGTRTGTQAGNGATTSTSLNDPTALAIDATGDFLYVADQRGSVILKIATSDATSVTTLTGSTEGHQDGALTSALFTRIQGMTFDASGNLYVSEDGNWSGALSPAMGGGNKDIRMISLSIANPVVSTLAGDPTVFGWANETTASFECPRGIAYYGGKLYAADIQATTIRQIDLATDQVSTLAGAPRQCGYKDGSPALFWDPNKTRFGQDGNLYILDMGNGRIRSINLSSGTVGTYVDYSQITDLINPNSSMMLINDFAMDKAGNVVLVDTMRDAIYKLSSSGELALFAGIPDSAYSGTPIADGPGGPDGTAVLGPALGICADPDGNFYIVDSGKIRMITTASDGSVNVSTVPGTDGIGAIQSIACGPDGSLYIVASNFVRKITRTPDASISGGYRYTMSTLAGVEGQSGAADGNASTARFGDFLSGIDVDATGNVYVTDYWNHAVRKITPQGTVSTVVGVLGKGENIPGPLPASIAFPWSVSVDPKDPNVLYISLADAILEANL